MISTFFTAVTVPLACRTIGTFSWAASTTVTSGGGGGGAACCCSSQPASSSANRPTAKAAG